MKTWIVSKTHIDPLICAGLAVPKHILVSWSAGLDSEVLSAEHAERIAFDVLFPWGNADPTVTATINATRAELDGV
jgi:hypothetical protein